MQYDGFAENEDEKVLSTIPTVSTTAIKTSDVGTYPITITGGEADNYDFSYADGRLTINKAEQTISWEQDLSSLMRGDQIELNAVASSGLPVTYTMDANDAGDLYTIGSKSYLDCTSKGRFFIRAVQSGNNNYLSSPRAAQAVCIESNWIDIKGDLNEDGKVDIADVTAVVNIINEK